MWYPLPSLLLFFSCFIISGSMLYSFEPYTAPTWANALSNPPKERVKLASGCPTPIHPWKPPGYEVNQMFIKRDDLTSFDLSGNKVRKLEFLMAQALREGHDSVVTIVSVPMFS